FLLSGERRYLLGHNIYDVSPGNIVIIPKNELHRTTALHNKGYERYVVYFYDDVGREFSENISGFDLNAFLRLGCVELPEDSAKLIRSYLEQMELESKNRDEYSVICMKNILRNIMITVLRNGKLKSREQNDDADKIQAVAKYIREYYYENITLENAAKIALMEKTYFSKRFKALTGFGFNEYLTETRIHAAENLLEFTTLDIGEVSERCGYSSSNYFGDVFKRYHGCSPVKYRKKVQK
ncbi:MAG: helix-turn-helix transcriptional regulator, partial [Clostridia bacterium]|nr:helix-turn-helix transcriptional regulator [Clostridia bacterium]